MGVERKMTKKDLCRMCEEYCDKDCEKEKICSLLGLLTENKKLNSENRKLKSENRRLKKRVEEYEFYNSWYDSPEGMGK